MNEFIYVPPEDACKPDCTCEDCHIIRTMGVGYKFSTKPRIMHVHWIIPFLKPRKRWSRKAKKQLGIKKGTMQPPLIKK